MMENYLLKSSVSLIIFYILYKVILHHEVNSQIKRFMGLASIIFSCGFLLIPTTNFFPSDSYPVAIQSALESSSLIQKSFSQTLPEDSVSSFLMIYLIGVGLFSLRFISGVVSLSHLYLSSQKIIKWGFKVVVTQKKISPFTFFNLLFIHKEDFEKEDIEAMIIHEQVHRDQFHSADMLILQLFSIFYWFNPAIWFFRKDIRAEHEFLADKQVLKKGFDRLDYQDMLFEARTGFTFQSVNNLSSKTSLKQRFNMMEKTKINTKSSYIRAAIFIPLMAGAILISSFSSALAERPGSPSAAPTFKVYSDDGEVDLTKGVPKTSKRLFVTVVPPQQNVEEKKFIVSRMITTFVGDGLGRGSMKTGGFVSLQDLLVNIDVYQEIDLILEIQQYQSKNTEGVVESFELEFPVMHKIPIR